MYKALVCCRAGMGSSMLLKIKVDQVIKNIVDKAEMEAKLEEFLASKEN